MSTMTLHELDHGIVCLLRILGSRSIPLFDVMNANDCATVAAAAAVADGGGCGGGGRGPDDPTAPGANLAVCPSGWKPCTQGSQLRQVGRVSG
jgi:hypothetical protein